MLYIATSTAPSFAAIIIASKPQPAIIPICNIKNNFPFFIKILNS